MVQKRKLDNLKSFKNIKPSLQGWFFYEVNALIQNRNDIHPLYFEPKQHPHCRVSQKSVQFKVR